MRICLKKQHWLQVINACSADGNYLTGSSLQKPAQQTVVAPFTYRLHIYTFYQKNILLLLLRLIQRLRLILCQSNTTVIPVQHPPDRLTIESRMNTPSI